MQPHEELIAVMTARGWTHWWDADERPLPVPTVVYLAPEGLGEAYVSLATDPAMADYELRLAQGIAEVADVHRVSMGEIRDHMDRVATRAIYFDVGLAKFYSHQAGLRIRRGGRGAYLKPEVKAYKAAISTAAHDALGGRAAPLFGDGFVELKLVFDYPPVRGQQSSDLWRRGKRPDLVNLAKLAEDALIGIVMEDDSQVSDMILRKRHRGGASSCQLQVVARQVSLAI